VPVLIALLLTQQPAGVAQQVFEVTGQVDRIDRSGRTISITSAGVVSAPIYAGPDLAIFDQLSSGDVVTVRYYDSVVVEVTPGARMKPLEDTTRAAQGAVTRPDASVLQQTRLVVTIDAVDAAKATVTYHGVDNRRVFRVVRDRRLLEGVKPGDVVTITSTRAQAVTITKR
jgi:Cu/Ag efflux protein CusF